MKNFIFLLFLSCQAVTWSGHSAANTEFKFGVIGLAAIAGLCTFGGVLLYKNHKDRCDEVMDNVTTVASKATDKVKKSDIIGSLINNTGTDTTDSAEEKRP